MEKINEAASICLKDTYIGIELGSTQIKAVLIGRDYQPLASGSFTWESRFENGNWTYALSDAWLGIQGCFSALRDDVRNKYGVTLDTAGCIGISGMMHGYLPFDEHNNLLTPFRTWRNTSTAAAAEKLTELFQFNIPQRWSVAHLYQAMLNHEEHVGRIHRLDTLASYVHRMLTGRHVAGIGEASGMFPICGETLDYDAGMLEKFSHLAAEYHWELEKLLPRPLSAGENAGLLTKEGALLIDPTGTLQAGIPLCPPEGDAGTGMTATNAVAPRTGNVSAGTSIFSMIVLEHELKAVHPEIDIVTTPTGKPVAMVHCNNCTADMNAWVGMFRQLLELAGSPMELDSLYPALYRLSLEGNKDCAGTLVCNYLAGEPVTGLAAGIPFVLRDPAKPFTLANFVRAQLYAALASLSIGMELLQEESVQIDRLVAHGGLFKTPGVGQRYLAAAVGAPVWVMKTAGMGGPYGMALLAAFSRLRGADQSLEDFLSTCVFANTPCTVLEPDKEDLEGFCAYLKRFRRLLEVERAAVEALME